MTTDKRRVLVTGASGLIGSDLIRALEPSYAVRTFSRREVPGFDGVRADIDDTTSLSRAMEDVQLVVHLSAVLPGEGDAEVLATNVNGTYNLFEATRQHGVERVVFASTGAISGGYMQDADVEKIIAGRRSELADPERTISEVDPPRPTGLYAVSKLWGENLGRYYSEAHGISTICVRLSRVIESDEPEDELRRSIHLSRRDAVQALVRSIEAPTSLRFAIFYVTSNNANRWRDNKSAARDIGFNPQD